MRRIVFKTLLLKWLHFFSIIKSDVLRIVLKMFFEIALQKQSSKQSLLKFSLKKVTVKEYIAELWTVFFNEIIICQLSTRGSVKLVVINVTYTCMRSYPLVSIGPAFSS